jgi:hypothetical protein
MHCPVKAVIALPIFDLKVKDAFTSVIYIVADVYGEAVSRYYSPGVHMVNVIELKHPNNGALVSPE